MRYIRKCFVQRAGMGAIVLLTGFQSLQAAAGQAPVNSQVSPVATHGPENFSGTEPEQRTLRPAAPGRSALQQQVSGTVSDRETSGPVSLVHVINKTTGDWTITGYQGEFVITAARGHELAFVKDDYISRVITLEDPGEVLTVSISKKPETDQDRSELLPEVTVYGKSYRADSLQLRREYERYFPSPPPNLKEAIGSDGSLDLNAYISRMMTPWDREFSERLLAYEQKKYIDKVFTEARVTQVVAIGEDELEEFMRTCRPSYSFLVTATEYDLVKYIRDAYDLYRSAKYGETLRHGKRD